MSNKVKVLLVEDHEMTRMGLQVGIEKNENLELVGEAADGLEGVNKAPITALPIFEQSDSCFLRVSQMIHLYYKRYNRNCQEEI